MPPAHKPAKVMVPKAELPPKKDVVLAADSTKSRRKNRSKLSDDLFSSKKIRSGKKVLQRFNDGRSLNPTDTSGSVVPDKAISQTDEILATIKSILIHHLGSAEAADAWLGSRDAGYPTTPLATINSGRGELVLADVSARFGPSPHYA